MEEGIKKAFEKMMKYAQLIGESMNHQEDQEEVQKEVQRFLRLPIADRDRDWNADEAEQRLREWAGGPEKEDIDFNQYFRGFMWRDEENPELFGSYKFPYADVIDGELTAVPNGILAVAQVLSGARVETARQLEIPRDDFDALKRLTNRWFERLQEEFPESDFTIPFPDIEMSAKQKKQVKKSYAFDILKADEEKQLVSGVVLEPNTVDLQGDIISAEEIEKTAHRFLTMSRQMGFRHKRAAEAEVVESFIAPKNMTIAGQKVKKGSWVITTKVNDELLWQAIKSGKINSFSVGGTAKRIPTNSIA